MQPPFPLVFLLLVHGTIDMVRVNHQHLIVIKKVMSISPSDEINGKVEGEIGKQGERTEHAFIFSVLWWVSLGNVWISSPIDRLLSLPRAFAFSPPHRRR